MTAVNEAPVAMTEKVKIPVKVGTLNRVGLPQEIRSILGISEGDYIIFQVIDHKVVVERL